MSEGYRNRKQTDVHLKLREVYGIERGDKEMSKTIKLALTLGDWQQISGIRGIS